MKCYGIATVFGNQNFDWYISNWQLRFFANRAITQNKEKLYNLYNQLESGKTWLKESDIYFYIHKLSDKCCIIAVSSALDEKQLNFLTYHLLIQKIDKELLAEDIETYTKDTKIEQLQKNIAETKGIMINNLELTLTRNEKIESLLEDTEKLKESTLKFKEEAKELNSCWPSCTLF